MSCGGCAAEPRKPISRFEGTIALMDHKHIPWFAALHGSPCGVYLRKWVFVGTALGLLLILAPPARAELLLSDQSSEVYYRLAVSAGDDIQVEKDNEVTGNVHSNADIHLKQNSLVVGAVSAVGEIFNQGTVDGTTTEGADALTLPALLDAADLQALADQVLSGDTIFTDALIDEVIFVDGEVEIQGSLDGEGTIIATGDIRLREDLSEPAATTRMSLISLNDIRLDKNRRFRGALRAGRDVMLEMSVAFEGVIVADRKVHVKKSSLVSFLDFDQTAPEITLGSPAAGSFVATATPEIAVSYTDDFSGLRLDSVELLVDGVDRTAEATVTETGLTFTPPSALSEGVHMVEVAVTDHSDNEGREVFELTIDTVAPLLAVSQPPATVFGDTTPQVVVDYADATSGVDLASLQVTLGGADLTASCVLGATQAVCESPELAQGNHTVGAAVSDLAGNGASTSFTFELILDNEPPVITVQSPIAGAVLGESPVAVLGTVSDESAIAGVTVNGQSATLAGSGFSALVELTPGANTLTVAAADVFGNSGEVSLTVTFVPDTTPPTLAITAPGSSVVVNDRTPSIVVAYADSESGVDLRSLVVRLDGVELGPCTVSLDRAGCDTAPLAAGPHQIAAEIQDMAGNTTTAAFTFELEIDPEAPDGEGPAILIEAPTETVIFDDPTPAIVVRYSDESPGVDLTTLGIAIDAIDLTADCQVGPELATCESPELEDGGHDVVVVLADLDGNFTVATFEFLLNPTNLGQPRIGLEEPGFLLLINQPAPPVIVVYEAGAATLDLATLSISLDGVELTAGCQVGPISATCMGGTLAEGNHSVAAEITDTAGNTASFVRDFELLLDDADPVITIAAPEAESELLNATEAVVSGTVTDDSGVDFVTVNGLPAERDGDSFTASVPVTTGPNTLAVLAVDRAGKNATASTTVNVATDTEPPLLSLSAPAPDSFVVAVQPAVALAFSDEGGVDLGSLAFAVNGAAAAFNCDLDAAGGSCTPVVPLADGAVDLEVSVADNAGNAATAGLAFIVDSQPVDLAITTPGTGLVTGGASVTVSGTASAGVTAVEVSGVPATLAGSTFSATVALREGTQMVVAVGRKANGNAGAASVEVTRDIQAPLVRIDSPRQGFAAIDGTLAVTGVVNDLGSGVLPPQVFVNGRPAQVDNGTFMLLDVSLVPGPNTLEAVAIDAVGNESRHLITVRREQPAGARLRLAAGNGQLGLVRSDLGEPLAVQVIDELGNPVAGRVVRFEVSRNSGTLRAGAGQPPLRLLELPTDGSGRAAVLFTLGDTSGEGNNRVRATALGVAGEVEFCASALASEPLQILMVEGDNQRGQVGEPLAQPLKALVLDADGNPIPGVPVTFTVTTGGGNIDGEAAAVRAAGADGRARAVFTLGPAPGVVNHTVSATFEGLLGSPATFKASGLPVGDPADTAIAGLVLDNAQEPIPGATVHIEGTTLTAVTDAAGQFLLGDVPVGLVELVVDPAASPRPESFPPLAFETVTVAGQVNTLGQPVLLPFIDTAGSAVVGGEEDVTLTMDGVEGLSLTVFANSATFPDGSPTGVLTISQVHLDKVPMPPPNGSLFMPPAWTIQPAGVIFDPPARITIPNDGLPIGRVIDIFQFDHTLNEFINAGKGTISADGSIIVSDPGFGITRSGWGGCGLPPPPPTCADGCPECKKCDKSSGNCVPKEGSCDDKKFCTSATGITPGPDKCENGSCSLDKKISDQERVDIGLQEWDFSKLADILSGVSRTLSFLSVCEVTPFKASGGINISFLDRCCEDIDDLKTVGKFSGSISIAAEIECSSTSIPGLKRWLDGGLFIGFGLSLGASGSGVQDDCDGCNWTVQGKIGAQISGGVKIKFLADDVLSAKLAVKGGGSLDIGLKCGDPTGIGGCIGPPSIMGSITLGGFLSKSVNIVPWPQLQACL